MHICTEICKGSDAYLKYWANVHKIVMLEISTN